MAMYMAPAVITTERSKTPLSGPRMRPCSFGVKACIGAVVFFTHCGRAPFDPEAVWHNGQPVG